MQYYIVLCNQSKYIYDIHALVSAFTPGYEVKVLTKDSVIRNREIQKASPSMELELNKDKMTCRFLASTKTIGEGWTKEDSLVSIRKENRIQIQNVEDHEYKNTLKLFVYDSLCKYHEKELPWGDLTGIRPTKIPMTMMEEGKTKEEIETFLKDAHRVSDDKITLAIDIAKRESTILGKTHGVDGYSMYIGVAFCPTTCLYCSFPSNASFGKEKVLDQYLACLEREIDDVADQMSGRPCDSIYIGGGTPTTFSAEQLQKLMDKIKSKFNIRELQEFTVEAGRPDSLNRAKLEVLKKAGVTRISINPQTMKEETLRLIGRAHTVQETRDAFALAREVGFDNINMDVILGLPGETLEDVRYTLEEITKMEPDNLTVHCLAIKKGSRMQQYVAEKGLPVMEDMDQAVELAAEYAQKMGLVPYYLYRQKHMSGNFENVGYAKPGKFGLYNILIMEEIQDIIACGAGVISKHVYPSGRIERCENVKEVSEYLNRVEEMIQRKRTLWEQ